MTARSLPNSKKQALHALLASVLLLAVYGISAASTEFTLLAYAIIVVAAVMPAYVWLMRSTDGIPVLPAFALAHIPYFAFSILRNNISIRAYDEDEILAAAVTVAMCLLAATAVHFIGGRRIRPAPPQRDSASRRHVNVLVSSGLLIAAMFQAGALTGLTDWLGTFFGTARSLAITFGIVAAYCLGTAAGQKTLTRTQTRVGLVVLAANVLLSWSSLFLVGGMMFVLATVLGYAVSTGKLPWKTFMAVFAVVSVLQAGKRDMRDEYWYAGQNYGGPAQILELPNRMVEWGIRGVDVLTRDDDFETDVSRQSVLDRTSLLQMLLLAQRMSPDIVPYLDGATYVLLPKILIPRFIFPDKPPSQAGMSMLNISYGLLLEHETERTAVGWGLVAEAYANFGHAGVVAIGILIGLFCRLVSTKSAGQSPFSLPTLIASVALMNLINVEADFTSLSLSFVQSVVAVLVLHGVLTTLSRRDESRACERNRFASILRK